MAKHLLALLLALLPALAFADGEIKTRPPESSGGTSLTGVTCTLASCTFTVPILGPAFDNCAAIPYSFTGDTTTGLCSTAAGVIVLRTAGVNRLTINSTAVTSTVPVLLTNPSSASSYTIQHSGALFSGTYDPILYLGYNLAPGTTATKIVAGEPIWKVALEGNWNDGAGANFAEFNLDYLSIDGLVSRRPIYTTVNRATNAVLMSLNADQFGIQDSASAQIMLAGTTNVVFTSSAGTVMTIGDDSGFKITGTHSATHPVLANLAAAVNPVDGEGAVGLEMRYNVFGSAARNLSYVRGVEMNGVGWTKGTSGTITTATAGYFTAPTIGTTNYALYSTGVSRFGSIQLNSANTVLSEDSAGFVGLTNTTNPTGLHVYKTYTDSTHYERIAVEWQGDVGYIWAQKGAAGGTSRSLYLTSDTGNVGLNTRGANADWTGYDFRSPSNDGYDFGYSANGWRTLYLTRGIQGSKSKALIEGATTTFATVAVPQTAGANFAGGKVSYTVYESDGTDSTTLSGTAQFAAVNKGGTESCAPIADIQTTAISTAAMTLTCTMTCVTGLTDVVGLAMNCTDAATMTQTILNILARFDLPQPATLVFP